MPRLSHILLAAPLLFAAASAADARLPGFSGIEFFRVGWGTHNLRVADVNGDGLKDIVVVNNNKARIDCLIQRANPEEAPEPEDLEPNQVPDDKRFKNRPYLAEKKIFGLELGDLNGDKRADMVYYGDPKELVVVYQNEKGEWGRRRTFDITDFAQMPYALAVGDINGDLRDDIVLCGTDGTYFIYQAKDGKLRAPMKEAGVPPGVSAIVLRDFDGDRRLDLLYLSFSEDKPFAFRFQGRDGKLGPLVRCRTAPLRAVGIGDPTGDARQKILAVKTRSGRLVMYETRTEENGDRLLEGAVERYTLRSVKSPRPPAIAVGCFTQPGRLDFVVTAAEANEIEMFFQDATGHWSGRTSFPTLQNVTDVAPIDSDGDGRDELLVLSPEESMLGCAHMDEHGRLIFPRALPVKGKPNALAVADLDADGKPEIIYTSSEKRSRALHVLGADDRGGFVEKLSLPLEKARTDPDGLRVFDMNQDGRPDICVFIPYEGLRVIKAEPDGKFTDVSQKPDYGKGLVQKAKRKQTGVADVDGDGKPELLLAVKNFARALRLDEKDRLQIVDQFNGRLPNSKVVAAAGADLDGDGVDEVILVDSSSQCLTALKRGATGAYTIVENFKLRAPDLQRILARDLDGDKRIEILLLTRGDCAVIRPGRPRIALKEIASYETPVRNGRLLDVSLGDLDGDRRDELLVTQARRNTIELLHWNQDKKELARALTWPVFEEKTYAGRRYGGESRSPEPREVRVADVTHDGKPDLILLIHDRILVYPQE